MNEGAIGENIPPIPSQDGIQEILHKVIIAHQQALALLQQTEAAYGRLVPHQLLNLLDAKSIVDVKLGDQVERKMTIMFSDIRDFTPLSESMTPAENFEFINSYLSQMEPVISRHHGIIDKYIGDAIKPSARAEETVEVNDSHTYKREHDGLRRKEAIHLQIKRFIPVRV